MIGLGRSGAAAAEALLAEGAQVEVLEAGHGPDLARRAERLSGLGARVTLGCDDDLRLLDRADLIVPSPGVAPSNRLIAEALARGVPVWSEVELGWSFARCPVIAVTGTNGKTTTTTLLVEMLREGGRAAMAAGNIGTPLVDVARSVGRGSVGKGSVIVCEVSSFQLALIDSFRPATGIVLNVADDHYDWHADHDDYREAKGRITANQLPDDLLVIRADDPGCEWIAARSSAKIAAFGLEAPETIAEAVGARLGRPVATAAGMVGEQLLVDEMPVINAGDIRLQGRHNIENVLAASLAALAHGALADALPRAVQAFEGLPHRTRLVAEVGGVRYIDDSKATNPHATLRALAGLHDVVLIAGGRSKGMDLSVLAKAQDSLYGLIVMGEASEQLEAVFPGMVWARASGIEEAVAIASSMASPGQTVLLSPACSSLDQYSSYAERGDRFSDAVLELTAAGRPGPPGSAS